MGSATNYASAHCPLFGPGTLVTNNEITRYDIYGEFYVVQDEGTISGEAHSCEITSTGTLSSGDGLVGLNIVTTGLGTSGAWLSGLFVNAVQATKTVIGYLCAAEFQLSNSGANASAMACLVLDWYNTSSVPGGAGGSTQAYIMLSDFSSGTKCSNLFEFKDQTIGSSDNDLTSLLAANVATASTHTIKFTIANVPYFIMCSNASLA